MSATVIASDAKFRYAPCRNGGLLMATLLRWAGYILGSLVLLVVLAAIAIWLLSAQKLHASVAVKPEHLAAPSAAQLADAERQARTTSRSSARSGRQI